DRPRGPSRGPAAMAAASRYPRGPGRARLGTADSRKQQTQEEKQRKVLLLVVPRRHRAQRPLHVPAGSRRAAPPSRHDAGRQTAQQQQSDRSRRAVIGVRFGPRSFLVAKRESCDDEFFPCP
ncbi:unnamed protein product, partial [Ectocarpus sp. 8 AP-2014]